MGVGNNNNNNKLGINELMRKGAGINCPPSRFPDCAKNMGPPLGQLCCAYCKLHVVQVDGMSIRDLLSQEPKPDEVDDLRLLLEDPNTEISEAA